MSHIAPPLDKRVSLISLTKSEATMKKVTIFHDWATFSRYL
jgi:hypothetical protein